MSTKYLLFRPVGKGLFIIKQHAMKLFFSFVFALLAFTACTKPEKEVYISLLIVSRHWTGYIIFTAMTAIIGIVSQVHG